MLDNNESTAAAAESRAQSPTKRKASVAGFPDGLRPVKRRAAKACQTCRSRKVRCDVVDSGPPCNNCRLDQIQCIVSDSRRKRKPRSNGDDEKSPVLSVAETDLGESRPVSTCHDHALDHSSPSENGDLFVNPSPGNSFEFELDHHVPHMLYRTQGHRLSQEERTRRLSMNSESTSKTTNAIAAPSWKSPASLPPHSRPLASTLKDVEYLLRKGSLLIHLLGAGSNDNTKGTAVAERHQQCMEIQQRLGDIQRAAGFARSFLQASMSRANIPVSLVSSNSGGKVEKMSEAPAVLTPPPEANWSNFLPHAPVESEQCVRFAEVSPPVSEETDESASSGEIGFSDDMNGTATDATNLDNDFDALFNLDADLDFLGGEEDESKITLAGTDASYPYPDLGKTPTRVQIVSEVKCDSSQAILHTDLNPRMGISV